MTEEDQNPDPQSLAAEYALGLLEGEDRVDFETRLLEDQELRAQVAAWQEHFASLGMDIEEVTPPASVLKHLKRELWDENRIAWHRRIRIWEFAVGGMAAALFAYGAMQLGWFSDPVPVPLRAQIQNPETGLQLVAQLDRQSGLLRLERAGLSPEDGRDFELWVIVEDSAPMSLGVMPKAQLAALRLDRTQLALVSAGAVLAVSDEPEGGSPTGAPTGAVLGAAPIQLLTNL